MLLRSSKPISLFPSERVKNARTSGLSRGLDKFAFTNACCRSAGHLSKPKIAATPALPGGVTPPAVLVSVVSAPAIPADTAKQTANSPEPSPGQIFPRQKSLLHPLANFTPVQASLNSPVISDKKAMISACHQSPYCFQMMSVSSIFAHHLLLSQKINPTEALSSS